MDATITEIQVNKFIILMSQFVVCFMVIPGSNIKIAILLISLDLKAKCIKILKTEFYDE